MHQVAPGVWMLESVGLDLINVYLADDVLIDGATRYHTWFLQRQLRGRKLSLVALTHCHPDHQGSARHFCHTRRIPLACHAADVPAMEGGPMLPRTFIVHGLGRLIAGPPHPVARVLHDGDQVGEFRVIHAPGHTPGQVIYFRDSDRVAIVGDVLANISFLTLKPGLRPPPSAFCTDPAQNRRSIELLASLNPTLVLFGHGPPLRKVEQLHWFVARMQKRFQ